MTQRKTVLDLIAHWMRQTPGAPAVGDRQQILSYGALDAAAARLARGLSKQRVGAGAVVALELPRSVDLIVGILALWKLGAAYVPVEPGWPAQRRGQVIQDAGACLVVTAGAEEPEAGIARVSFDSLNTAPAADQRPIDDANRRVEADERAATEAGAIAYIIYTSGSTGTPKGVRIAHASLANYVEAVSSALNLDATHRWALTSSVAADLGYTALFGALCNGAYLAVADDAIVKDGGQFAAFLRAQDVNAIKIVPSHLEALLEEPTLLPPARIVLGGESLTAALVRRIRSRNPASVLFNHYGPAETTVGVMVSRVDTLPILPPVIPLTDVLAGNAVAVLDGNGSQVAQGETGELCIAGAQRCLGYTRSEPVWVEAPDAGLPTPAYRTGDLARRLPGGAIELIGRIDHQVKVRGFRVDPGEIEAALAQHSAVRTAAVLASPAAGGEVALTAFILPMAGAARADVGTLGAWLAERLPAYMVPTSIVPVERFVRLDNGKIDRAALARSIAPAASARAVHEETDGAIEHQVAACMAELLGTQLVTPTDDFFDLGGHSVMVIKLVARLRKRLGVNLTPADVFEHPSAAALGRLLARATPSA
ncbi:hypothetical protein CAL29_14795 [Bordetella genomosp. 10]|uniref:Carrier domain-containing protein n=1 Tax=Bordetella genomosp. 10 TaxID=1416804 RepID=A0A261SCM1_9BORD|nr:non-ribosomal peptide synthetase [Bordetella genomosp. 10]OZI34737.1 hypothetical protein CAL29_14795 [Bordetella genomosp. 10]